MLLLGVYVHPGLGGHSSGHGCGRVPGWRGQLQQPLRVASVVAAAAGDRCLVREVTHIPQPTATGSKVKSSVTAESAANRKPAPQWKLLGAVDASRPLWASPGRRGDRTTSDSGAGLQK